MIRRLPPVFSPLPLGALLRSAPPGQGSPRDTLRATIQNHFGVEEVLLCGSGTQALQLALRAACSLGEKENDLVALPAFTCYDVASAAIGAGVQVVFYDIDPRTLAPDMASLAGALRHGPAAIVVAPLFGYQPDWDALRALTTDHGVLLVEDAAQSFGSLWNGRAAGGLGDLSTLSFGRGKGWTAVEGGAVLGSGPALERLPPLPGQAITRPPRILLKGAVQWAFGRPALYGLPNAVPGLNLGETIYHPPVAPRAMSSLSTRLALGTLGAATMEAETRRARTRAMTRRLQAEGGQRFHVPLAHARSESGGLRLPVLASAASRDRLLERGRPLGVLASYPRPLPELTPLKPHVAGEASTPGAKELAASLVTLPTHSLATEADMERILRLFVTADD